MYQNTPGALAGAVLTIIGILLIMVAVKHYKKIQGPGEKLGKNFLISVSLFTAGSIGVIIDSLTETELWFIMAISYTLSYMLLVSSVGFYLSALSFQEPKPKKHHKKTPTLPISGAYAFKKPANSEGLTLLSKYSSGLLAVSRRKKDLWVKKYGLEPDRFIWLSRIEEKDAIDPTKLHVLQDEIIRFLVEMSGKAVVYFEGIEYLILYNDFSSVAKFLFSLKDYVTSNESLLILYLPPNVLDKTQESVLLKEFQEKEEDELLKEISQKLVVRAVERENQGGGP